MKLLVVLLLVVGFAVSQSLDCSETACIAIYEYCEEGSCHTFSGCCPACCDEPCVDCLVSPCDNYACGGHPEYTCREDYCGGCNRLWFDGNGARTTCDNELFGEDPCAAVSCPVVDFCAGCGTVRDGCCERCCETDCANCLVDPCEGYACQGYPGYQCQSNYCGGCSREWISSKGEPVFCAIEIFEEHPCAVVDCMMVDEDSCGCGLQPTDGCCPTCCNDACALCLVDPCAGYTCLDNEKFTCESNYCGGCNRLWHDENGNRQFCSNEAAVDTEPPVIDCSLVRCAQPTDCACGTEKIGCCDVCIEEVQCFVNPCESVRCADNEEYTCEANYCGGCNREWADRNGNSVICKEEIFGNEDCFGVMCPMFIPVCGKCGTTTIDCCLGCVEEVQCLVNPCDNVSCAQHPDYKCEANYCGGCNRDWLDNAGNSVECEREIFNSEWLLECAQDLDCALHNVDHGFGCCYDGFCETVDFSRDTWRPVNTRWWQSRHEACSTNCGPQPGCATQNSVGENFVAICKNSQCTKVNSLLVVNPPVPVDDTNSESTNTISNESRNTRNNSSATALVAFWALLFAGVLIAV